MIRTIERANNFLLAGDFQLAEILYKKVLADEKRGGEAKFGLALSLFQQFRFHEAKEIFLDLSKDISNQEIEFWMLECFFMLGEHEKILCEALDKFRNTGFVELAAIAVRSERLGGNWNQAKLVVEEVLHEDVASSYFLSEALLLQIDCPMGDSKLAIKTLSAMHDNSPGDDYFTSALIYALIRQGEVCKAKKLLLAWRPIGVVCAIHDAYLAWLSLLAGDVVGAEVLCTKIMKKIPHHPLANLIEGYVHMEGHSYIRSAKSFSKLLNAYEGMYRESRVLAEMLMNKLHNYPMAFNAYSKVLAVDGGRQDDFFSIAWIAFHTERLDAAEKYINAANILFGHSVDGDAALAVLASASGQFVDMLKVVYSGYSGNGVFYLYLCGIFYAAKSEYEKAKFFLLKALKYFPDDLLLVKALVDIYLAQSLWNDALETGEPVLIKVPHEFELRSQMIRACLMKQDYLRLEAHENLMFRYCIDKYEPWLWGKLQEQNVQAGTVALYMNLAVKAIEQVCNFRFDEKAEKIYLKFIPKIKEERAVLVFLYFRLLMAQERFDDCFELIESDEDLRTLPEIDVWRARVFVLMGKYELAEACASKVLLSTNDIVAYDLMAYVYGFLGFNKSKIEALYNQALALYPNNDSLMWNYAHYLTSVGDCRAADLYIDAGLRLGARQPARQFMMPMWAGESLHGKTILVWREQGIGDELYMSMYYGDLIKRALAEGGLVKIECSDRLLTLMRRSYPQALINVESMNDDMTRTDFDYHLPSFSLRKHFQNEYVYPAPLVRHLLPQKKLQEIWRFRLAGLGDGLKIGICWHSSLLDASRKPHYAELEDLAPLMALQRVHWINLNYSGYREDAVQVRNRYGVVMHVWDDLDLKNDFEGMAALTSELDLVISAASSPGVLARCLGCRTWYFGFGSEHPDCEPTEAHTINYPALTWRKHHSETYQDLFRRMAIRIQTFPSAGM